MLYEEVKEADFVVFDLREFGLDVGRDEVAPTGLGGEGESLLEPAHVAFH